MSRIFRLFFFLSFFWRIYAGFGGTEFFVVSYFDEIHLVCAVSLLSYAGNLNDLFDSICDYEVDFPFADNRLAGGLLGGRCPWSNWTAWSL